MTERELQKGVLDVCKLFGYRVHHTRAAQTQKGWRTPLQGDKGFCDLVICGHGRVLFRELKVGRNTLSEEQAAWILELRAAGADAGVWTDHDWRDGVVEAELRRMEAAA